MQGPSSSWDRDFLHVGQVAEKAFDVDFRSEIGEWRKDFFPEWRNGIMHQLMSALNPGVLLPSVGVLRSIPGGSVHGERANFTGLVLGCTSYGARPQARAVNLSLTNFQRTAHWVRCRVRQAAH